MSAIGGHILKTHGAYWNVWCRRCRTWSVSHRGVTIMVADLHFPQFFGTAIKCEIARHFPRSVVKVGLNVQCKNISILSGVQPWTSTDLKLSYIFQYIICEPFRSWKRGLAKLDVNLWEIWRKFKCRRSMSYPLVWCTPSIAPLTARGAFDAYVYS